MKEYYVYAHFTGDSLNKVVLNETRSKMRESRRGHTPNLGKVKTVEAKLKVSRSIINCRGEVFSSLKQASKVVGIGNTTICECLKGRSNSAGKYSDGTRIKWKYIS
jgi:hypothetical protein